MPLTEKRAYGLSSDIFKGPLHLGFWKVVFQTQIAWKTAGLISNSVYMCEMKFFRSYYIISRCCWTLVILACCGYSNCCLAWSKASIYWMLLCSTTKACYPEIVMDAELPQSTLSEERQIAQSLASCHSCSTLSSHRLSLVHITWTELDWSRVLNACYRVITFTSHQLQFASSRVNNLIKLHVFRTKRPSSLKYL